MSAWTAERIAMLRRLWDAGETLNAIAEKMRISRGAVAGKARRLNLFDRGQDWFGQFGPKHKKWRGGREATNARRHEKRRAARAEAGPEIVKPKEPPIKKIKPGRICAFTLGFRDR